MWGGKKGSFLVGLPDKIHKKRIIQDHTIHSL